MPILPTVLLGFLVYAVAFEWRLVIVFSRRKKNSNKNEKHNPKLISTEFGMP